MELTTHLELLNNNQDLLINENGQIINNQGEILTQLKGMSLGITESSKVTQTLIQDYRQQLTKINEELASKTDKMFGQICVRISTTLGQSFEINPESQNMGNLKEVVQTVISEVFALKEIEDLTNSIQDIQSSIDFGTLVTQYSSSTRNLRTIFNHFDRAKKGASGLLERSKDLDWFKESTVDPITGIIPSIDILFDMYTGSIWNGGKSVFEIEREFACKQENFQYFMMTINKGIKLFRRVMALDGLSVEAYEEDWHSKTAYAYSEYFKHCGCPLGLQLEKSGNLSHLVEILPPNPGNNFTENLIKINELDKDTFFRKKAQAVLEIQNFDITPQSIKLLDNFWYEDIEMLSSLMKEGKLGLSHLYDGIKKCINPEKNCKGDGCDTPKQPSNMTCEVRDTAHSFTTTE